MKDIKKRIHFNFIQEIPVKMRRPKKIKNCYFFVKRPPKFGEIWSSTFSMIFKKSYLEGVFEFLHPDPQLDQHFKPTRNLCGQLLTLCISIYIHDIYTTKYKENWRKLLIPRPIPPHQTRAGALVSPFGLRKASAGPRREIVVALSTLLPHSFGRLRRQQLIFRKSNFSLVENRNLRKKCLKSGSQDFKKATGQIKYWFGCKNNLSIKKLDVIMLIYVLLLR